MSSQKSMKSKTSPKVACWDVFYFILAEDLHGILLPCTINMTQKNDAAQSGRRLIRVQTVPE